MQMNQRQKRYKQALDGVIKKLTNYLNYTRNSALVHHLEIEVSLLVMLVILELIYPDM